MKYEIKFSDLFEFAEDKDILTISGKAWKGLVVPNKKVLLTSEREISNITETLKNAPLQADHSKSIKDTCGRVFESTQDGDSVLYRAKVHDKEISQKIRDGLINQCSVSLAAADIKENFEYNGEEGWTALSGVSVVELSLVLRGAVTGNSVLPEFSFNLIEDNSMNIPNYSATVESLQKEFDKIEKQKLEVELIKDLMQTVENQKAEIENFKKRLFFEQYAHEFEWKDKYYKYSLSELQDLIENAIELSRFKYIPKGAIAPDETDFEPIKELKEDIREMIFKTRRDGKELKKLNRESDLDKNVRL